MFTAISVLILHLVPILLSEGHLCVKKMFSKMSSEAGESLKKVPSGFA